MATHGTRLYVGNVKFTTTGEGLRAAFASFGPIKDVHLVEDRETGQPRGFGFVEFVSGTDAEKAREEMDGADLDGRTLKVSEANERPSTGGGGGGRGRRDRGHDDDRGRSPRRW